MTDLITGLSLNASPPHYQSSYAASVILRRQRYDDVSGGDIVGTSGYQVMVVVKIKSIALKMKRYHHYLPLLDRTTSGLWDPPPGLAL